MKKNKTKHRFVKEIEEEIKKEKIAFALRAKRIVDAISDEKSLKEFTKQCLERLYKYDPKLFAEHSKLKLKKK